MAEVFTVERLRIDHDPRPLVLDPALEALAADHFRARKDRNPHLYDGEILLFRDVSVGAGALSATAVTCRYSVMVTLLDERPEGLDLVNLFGAAAPLSRDGALLLGRMGPKTFEPGEVKFASGTPDLEDVDRPGGSVDLDGSIVRELAEETGLDAAEATPAPDCLVAREGPYLAVVRPLVFPQPGEALRERVRTFLVAERDPELSGVELVRRPDDAALADAAPLVVPLVRALAGSGRLTG